MHRGLSLMNVRQECLTSYLPFMACFLQSRTGTYFLGLRTLIIIPMCRIRATRTLDLLLNSPAETVVK